MPHEINKYVYKMQTNLTNMNIYVHDPATVMSAISRVGASMP